MRLIVNQLRIIRKKTVYDLAIIICNVNFPQSLYSALLHCMPILFSFIECLIFIALLIFSIFGLFLVWRQRQQCLELIHASVLLGHPWKVSGVLMWCWGLNSVWLLAKQAHYLLWPRLFSFSI